jgi:hypothetical protein
VTIEIDATLDRDGELPVTFPISGGEDYTIYFKETDLYEVAAAFGYALYKRPTTDMGAADGFIEAIHRRTPTGAWIAVRHHPNGDWSVAHHPLPWLSGEGKQI